MAHEETRTVILWHGRVFCPTCRVVATVVCAPESEIRCPKCESLTVPAHGKDDLGRA